MAAINSIYNEEGDLIQVHLDEYSVELWDGLAELYQRVHVYAKSFEEKVLQAHRTWARQRAVFGEQEKG